MMDSDLRTCEEIWNYLILSGGYNGEVDEDILNVMRVIKEIYPNQYVTDIAQKLNLKETHVELIQYILCTMDLAEYGTSPRGCWLTEKGEQWLKMFNEREEGKK